MDNVLVMLLPLLLNAIREMCGAFGVDVSATVDLAKQAISDGHISWREIIQTITQLADDLGVDIDGGIDIIDAD